MHQLTRSTPALAVLFACAALACRAPAPAHAPQPQELVVSRLVVQGDGGSRAVIEDLGDGMSIKFYSADDKDSPSLVVGSLSRDLGMSRGLWMTDASRKSVVLLDISPTTQGFPISRLAFGDYPAPFMNSTYLSLMGASKFPSNVVVFDTRSPMAEESVLSSGAKQGWILAGDGTRELVPPGCVLEVTPSERQP